MITQIEKINIELFFSYSSEDSEQKHAKIAGKKNVLKRAGGGATYHSIGQRPYLMILNIFTMHSVKWDEPRWLFSWKLFPVTESLDID